MGDLKIIVKGVTGVNEGLLRIVANVDRANERIVRKGGTVIARNAKKEFKPRPLGSMRTSKSGKVYYASKPPYAPKPPTPTSRSGNLRDSITTETRRVGPGIWMSTTGPTMIYGRRVELGGGKNRAFPYLAPGFKKSKEELEVIYKKEWAEALA
jgi:hypothetical protein